MVLALAGRPLRFGAEAAFEAESVLDLEAGLGGLPLFLGGAWVGASGLVADLGGLPILFAGVPSFFNRMEPDFGSGLTMTSAVA